MADDFEISPRMLEIQLKTAREELNKGVGNPSAKRQAIKVALSALVSIAVSLDKIEKHLKCGADHNWR